MMVFTIDNQQMYEITSFVYTFQKNENQEYEITMDCHLDSSVVFEDVIEDIKDNFEGNFKIINDESVSHEFTNFVFSNLKLFVDMDNAKEKTISFIKTVN